MAYLHSVDREHLAQWEAPAGRDLPGIPIAVLALRRYGRARQCDEVMLHAMSGFASDHAISTHAIIALTSVFELTEACLGRLLNAQQREGGPQTSDEEAMLMLLSNGAGVGSHCGSDAIPHGLPGALAWAVRSANKLCGRQWTQAPASFSACPFGP